LRKRILASSWHGVLAFVLAIACEPAPSVSFAFAAEGRPPIPVILISVDTLRADRLGCYGYRGQGTPHIDAMAKGATLFAAVGSQVPLTLPSHVSLLTSTYPFWNGIEDNGEQLGPNIATLATLLKSRGYHTAAFVGGFVLDRRFGLNQGFEVYDSPFDLHQKWGAHPEDIKRLGEDVVGAATEWLGKSAGRPFFLFVHLYDLHAPYNLPPAFHTRFHGTGYEAELSYVDEVLGRFWEFLSRRGLLEKALIVFISDHGEGLGEHSESAHGYFIYQSTLSVPLIIHWPGTAGPFPARVDEPTGLIDVAPTILQFVGVARPGQFQGRSLLGLLTRKAQAPDEDVYSETVYPHDYFGLSPLHSLRAGRYKYIEAPKPEFYDLVQDPGETRNLYASEKALAFTFHERLRAFQSRFRTGGPAPSRAPSPELVARLSSLGYVAVSNAHSESAPSAADPKDHIGDYESYWSAIALASSGHLAESNRRLQELLAKNPDLFQARLSLGLNAQKLGRYEEAVRDFRLVLKENPLNSVAHFYLGESYLQLNQLDDAIKELQAVLAIAPYYTKADEALGKICLRQKDYEGARGHFRHILTFAPDNFEAHYNLGSLAMLKGQWEEAARHYQAALKADPETPEAHNALGSLYLMRGDLARGQEEFSAAIRLDSNFAPAHYNLGLIFLKASRNSDAAREFRQALAADPQFRAAGDALEQIEHPKP
jgi:choline-sulfatase